MCNVANCAETYLDGGVVSAFVFRSHPLYLYIT